MLSGKYKILKKNISIAKKILWTYQWSPYSILKDAFTHHTHYIYKNPVISGMR